LSVVGVGALEPLRQEDFMRTRFRNRLGASLAIVLVAAPAAAAQEKSDEPAAAPASVRPSDVDDGIPIVEFIKKMSADTGQAMLFAPSLENTLGKRKIKVLQPPRVANKDLFEYDRSILKANDLVLFSIGPASYDLWVIDDIKAAGPAGFLRASAVFVPVDQLEKWRDRTEMISVVMPLHNVDISRARQELGQLVNTRNGAAITSVESSNSLIVTDFAPTVWSIYQVLATIDQKEKLIRSPLHSITLHSLRCEELAAALSRLVDDATSTSTPEDKGTNDAKPAPAPRLRTSTRIVAERQTNSLLVQASDEDFDVIRVLVGRLEERAQEQKDAAKRTADDGPPRR
jgi:type II secretory pathway component GspD/PulD (secretin)